METQQTKLEKPYRVQVDIGAKTIAFIDIDDKQFKKLESKLTGNIVPKFIKVDLHIVPTENIKCILDRHCKFVSKPYEAKDRT